MMPARRPPVPVKEFHTFVEIVRRLRRDCPWDRKQTHRSLRHSFIEEAYEVIEALDTSNLTELRAELGDVLLHVVLQATIAEQAGEFTLAELLQTISEKLIRRHPHVFGTRKVRNAEEVKQNWEKLKMAEGRASVLEGVPPGMPALARAQRVQERASKVGFDWKHADDVWEKVREEMEEVAETLRGRNKKRREEEFGDLLFALVNYARFIDVNAENALRESIGKFTHRFRQVEQELHRRGTSVHASTLEEMDAVWNAVKQKKQKRRVSLPSVHPSPAPPATPGGTSRKRR